MKKALIVVALSSCLSAAFAYPSYDTFTNAAGLSPNGTTYATGAFLAHQTNAFGEGWSLWNGGNTNIGVQCVNSNLVFGGFPAAYATPPANNSVFIPGQDLTNGGVAGISAALKLSRAVSKDPNNAVTNKIYASFLLSVPTMGNLSSGSPIYLGGFATNASDQNVSLPARAVKLFMKGTSVNPAAAYQIGIADNSGSGTAHYYSSALFPGDVHFVVMDYEFGINGGADTANIWVDPSSGAFGAPEATRAAPSAVTTISTAGNKLTNAADFYLLTRTGATLWGSMVVGDLSVGDTWSYVTGGVEITNQPASMTNQAGSTAIFTVGAIATAININALTYQWRLNGNPLTDGGNISGSSTPTLTITGINSANVGAYSVAVANAVTVNNGYTIVSSNAVLTMDPQVTSNPVSVTFIPPGGNTSFSITATGTPTLTYQWLKNGVSLANGVSGTGTTYSGATTFTLNLSTISGADNNAAYSCAVTNGLGNGTVSASATLGLGDPGIQSPPQPVTLNFGGTAHFSVTAGGAGPFTYQWISSQFGNLSNGSAPSGSGASISGATAATLNISGAAYADEANYSVMITDPNGNVTSPTASLTVIDPIIATQPASITNVAGTAASFTVSAQGTSPIAYQWLFNGNPLTDGGNISGSTAATLAINPVQDNNAGNYSVVVTGAGQTGSSPLGNVEAAVTSSTAALTVLHILAVTGVPQSRTERVGDHLAFVLGVDASSPTFTWYFNNNLIASPTGNMAVTNTQSGNAGVSALVITNLQLTNAGTYSVVASNNVQGTITVVTNTAVLAVTNGLLPLSTNNLIVVREGDGAQLLNTNSGNSFYFDQFGPNGAYVSTILIPDSGPTAIICDGGVPDGNVEGFLTLSGNQQYLNFAGFNLGLPNTNTSFQGNGGGATTGVPRAIGAVNALGFYALCLTNTGLYSAGIQIRSAVSSDGLTNFWTTGSGGGGVKWITPAQGPAGIIQLVGNTDPRIVEIFNDNLYLSTGNGQTGALGLGEFAVGTAAATNTAITLNALSVDGAGDPNDFAFSPDGNTVYVADDSAPGNNGGVQRWDFNGSAWVNSYTLSNDLTVGVSGLAVNFNNIATWGAGVTGASLYATTAGNSQNQLITITDTGAGSAASVLATAGPNQLYRGVRFGPAQAPVIITSAPQNQSIFVGDDAFFSVGVSGDAPFFYQWQSNSVNIAGATNATLLLTNLQTAATATYSVTITNAFSSASASASLTISPFNSTSDLVGWWKFDDAAGTTALDSSSFGDNGSLNNFPGDNSEWVTGVYAGALNFANVDANKDNVVLIPDQPQLNFNSNLAFTLSAWVKSATNTQFSGACIINKGFGSGGEQYTLDVFTGNSFRFYVRNAAGDVSTAQSTVPVNGGWQQLVASFNASEGIMNLYVNGILVRSATPPGTLLSSTSPVAIGNRQSASNSVYNLPFQGLIDDVRIYNYALGAADVAAIYGGGEPPKVGGGTVLANGTFQLSFSGPPGVGYRVWASTNAALQPVTSTWSLLSSGTFGSGSVTFNDTQSTNFPTRFYTITSP